MVDRPRWTALRGSAIAFSCCGALLLVAGVAGAASAAVGPPQESAPREKHTVDSAGDAAAFAEWIAIAPRALCDRIEPLAAHRVARGAKSAAIVPVESIEARHGNDLSLAIRAFAKDARAHGGGRFLLLVGDANDIPPALVRVGSAVPFVSDAPLLPLDDGGLPDAAIGRFPTSRPEEVSRLVERTLAYESDTRPGAWRRRVSFLAGSGGFGVAIDGAMDAAVAGLLDRDLPPEYDLRVLRPDPNSVYGTSKKRERAAIRDLWNSGSLVMLFAGHGSRFGLHTADSGAFTRTLFRVADANQLEVRAGAPFVMLFACNTAEFAVRRGGRVAAPEGAGPSCLAAALLLNPKGAIAVLGASEVSHPYPDLLLAHAMNDAFRRDPRQPLGEMIREAKRRMASGASEFQQRVDSLAALFGLGDTWRAELREIDLALYNFLGDPALSLRAPDLPVRLDGPASAKVGESFEIEVKAEGAENANVLVGLEANRAAAPEVRGFPEVNDRVADRAVGRIEGGRFVARLRAPARLAGKVAVVVADVRREVGVGGEAVQGAAARLVRIE